MLWWDSSAFQRKKRKEEEDEEGYPNSETMKVWLNGEEWLKTMEELGECEAFAMEWSSVEEGEGGTSVEMGFDPAGRVEENEKMQRQQRTAKMPTAVCVVAKAEGRSGLRWSSGGECLEGPVWRGNVVEVICVGVGAGALPASPAYPNYCFFSAISAASSMESYDGTNLNC